MPKKNAHKCPEGNTIPQGGNRVRFFPNFTSFLETEPTYDSEKMRYLIYGSETCPDTGKHHWQGAVYFKDKCSVKTAQKLLNIGLSHMEFIQKSGDAEDAIEYCKKEGSFKEFGEFPQQGKRTDLLDLRDRILEGTSVDEILIENPNMFHQYGRTLSALEDIRLSKIFRTKMTKGIWYWGKTGTGKSHKAYNETNYHPDTHYRYPNDNGWWDNYKQQDTVIFNEFRGNIPYEEMLEIVDKWPHEVKRRGRPPLPFTSSLVIVTSSLHPAQVYNNLRENDDIAQLLDRFEIIKLEGDNLRKSLNIC